jgi:hypothetical protein
VETGQRKTKIGTKKSNNSMKKGELEGMKRKTKLCTTVS